MSFSEEEKAGRPMTCALSYRSLAQEENIAHACGGAGG